MIDRSVFTLFCGAGAAAAVLATAVFAAGQNLPPVSLKPRAANVSLSNEVQHAINNGWAWLEKHQDTNGFWSTVDHPAITALALTSYRLQSGKRDPQADPPGVTKGYAYLMSCVQPDGGIYRKDLPSYNTSISLVALVLAGRTEYQPAILRARRFIIGLQAESGDNALDGGIGYGKSDKKPDLSNTMDALEALYISRSSLKEQGALAEGDLNWAAAIHFIQSCQNLPGTNTEKWASDDPQNKGGFIYAPGVSKAGETNLPSGRIALRSYGSMSYAGLLSYIYADLKPGDPRVTAVMDWLRANYTLDENPAMGAQGLFYYYNTMAKALTLYGAQTLAVNGGQNVDWREQLALKLINLQHTDGSWANENGRFFEKDPALVTSYALISLEMIEPKL
jgi:squalene-hopene/tetraprenyl-beta-curcumene cyclase